MKKTEKTGRKMVTSILVLFVALTIASCASTEGEQTKNENSLKQAVESFNDSFRYEDYTTAAAFVPRDKREEFWAEADRFKGRIRLSEFELREVQCTGKGDLGTALLHFQYWRPEAPVLKSVTFTQRWVFSVKEKIWRVVYSGYDAIYGAK
jgi:hypothetical protein